MEFNREPGGFSTSSEKQTNYIWLCVRRARRLCRRCQLTFPTRELAQAYRRSVLGTEMGPYSSYTNSCVTHVVNVLNAGGADLPKTTNAAIAALKALSGG